MSKFYTRLASASLKEETVANTPVIPDVFFKFLDEGIDIQYPFVMTQDIMGSRSKALCAVRQAIPAPTGNIKVNVDANQFGYFLNGVYELTSGIPIDITSITGTFAVGETITGGSSGATATVDYVAEDFLILSSPTGTFTDGETVTGGTSSATATANNYDSAVKGHAGKLSKTISKTYSVQLNYRDSAIRLCGVRFAAVDNLSVSDNTIQADVKMMAQSVFRNAKCESATAGSAVAVTVDVSKGLVTGDEVKVLRPSTGLYIDLGAVGNKVTTLTVTSETVATLGTVTDNILDGDTLVLAPQSGATYDTTCPFTYVGGATVKIGETFAELVTENVEDFSLSVNHEYEERHSAQGTNFADLFPSDIIQKGIDATGSMVILYEHEKFTAIQRCEDSQFMTTEYVGAKIASTDIRNTLKFYSPAVYLQPFSTPVTVDDLVEQGIDLLLAEDPTSGYVTQVLLKNNVTSY